ncbi:hypothetical protein P7K49_034233, partial [Saguinus oedipus]
MEVITCSGQRASSGGQGSHSHGAKSGLDQNEGGAGAEKGQTGKDPIAPQIKRCSEAVHPQPGTCWVLGRRAAAIPPTLSLHAAQTHAGE